MRGVMRRDDPRLGSVDVATVIRDAERLAEAEARDRDVSLTTLADAKLPPIRGDEVQLVQVVLNLILNGLDALESVPRERRRIVVRASETEGGAEIAVLDTGPGIDPALVDKVFEPFFTTKARGLGMGLAITRSIVEAHGGHIRVLPAPGGGCTFRVFLPEARPEREAIAHG